MTAEETAALCAYVEAANPSQRMGEMTPLVWHDILPPDFTLGECRAAAGAIIRRGARYVDLGEIISEVKRARRPAAEAARLAMLLDPAAMRAEIAARDAETPMVLARIADRAGRPRMRLKAVPPPDYGGDPV